MSMYRRFGSLNFMRLLSAQAQKCTEKDITKVLIERFPKGNVNVTDVSGGCGAMFEVFVEAKEFEGLSVLKQHKIITEALKNEIQGMHGVRIHTSVPKS